MVGVGKARKSQRLRTAQPVKRPHTPGAPATGGRAAPAPRKAARERKHGAGTGEQIAAAALAILETEGAAAVSMHRVARELGVTPMALYHHYKNRQALLQRLVDEEIKRLAGFAAFIDLRPSADGFAAAMEQIVDRYLDYAFTRGHVFDYVFNVPREDALKYPQDFRAGRSPSLTPVAEWASQMMAAGHLHKDDNWEVAMQLWAQAHGYVTLYRAGRFDMDEETFRAFYHRAMRRLLHGLLASVPD